MTTLVIYHLSLIESVPLINENRNFSSDFFSFQSQKDEAEVVRIRQKRSDASRRRRVGRVRRLQHRPRKLRNRVRPK